MESLCGWIRRLSSSVENIAFLGAKDKVVRYLVELSAKADSAKTLELPEKKKKDEGFFELLQALETVEGINRFRISSI